MESFAANQHDPSSGRLDGREGGRVDGPIAGSSLAGGLSTLAGPEPASEGFAAYFAEVSRARNVALKNAGQSSRVPRCECNEGIRDRARRLAEFGDAPAYFTASDRSMVFHVFHSHSLVMKPRTRNWLVLLGDDYLKDCRGRRRWFGSSASALKAANKAEGVIYAVR